MFLNWCCSCGREVSSSTSSSLSSSASSSASSSSQSSSAISTFSDNCADGKCIDGVLAVRYSLTHSVAFPGTNPLCSCIENTFPQNMVLDYIASCSYNTTEREQSISINDPVSGECTLYPQSGPRVDLLFYNAGSPTFQNRVRVRMFARQVNPRLTITYEKVLTSPINCLSAITIPHVQTSIVGSGSSGCLNVTGETAAITVTPV